VRAAKIVMCVLLIGVPTWAAAQTAGPAAGAPEVIRGTAQAKNANGAVSGTIEIRIGRYTPAFDRKTVETALLHGGYPRFLTALRNAPEVGQLVLAGGEPFIIRYAREDPEATGRVLVIVTDRPLYFVGAARAGAKPRPGYEVGVLRVQLDAAGQGSGIMAAAARVRPDGDGGVLLDDYAEVPIELVKLTRAPAPLP
jgi:hypothetical protein